MKRRIVAFAAAGAALLAVGACAPSSDDKKDDASGSPAANQPVALTVWSWRTEDVDKYNRIFDVYEAAHPGVTIEFEASLNTEYNQILTTGLEGSDGPDVAQVRAYGQLQGWVEADQLLALDDLVPDLQKIDPTVLAAAEGRRDGLHYSVPFATQTMTMFYNKAIFDRLGLSEPATWDEFIALNEALKADGLVPMALGAKDAWVLPIFHDVIGATRYGGLEFEAAILSGQKTFTDPDYVASIQLLADLTPYLPENVAGVAYADSQLLFTTEAAAQFPGGGYELATFQTQNPDLEIGVYQVPPAPGAVSSTVLTPAWGDGGYAVNAKSEKRDAAVELVKWMATAEFGQLFADEIKQFSPIPGVTYDDPLMQEMWDGFTEHPSSYLLLVNFRYGEPMGTAVLGEEVQKIFLGDQDAAGAAAALQEGISQWFTPES
ncbi:MAG: extracellular solute-binding protein [Bifidobacteriaceae bacterium]|jgi:raffinose/stachyose/melibiose transport system substrate-binding protein|nr:extracellular solute-binding protein [Bifidobacteriaceae bacterium]